MSIDAEFLAFVRVLSDGGDDEQAVQLLSAALADARPARTEPEAVAVAEAVGLLLRLGTTPETYPLAPERLRLLAELTGGVPTPAVREACALAELEGIEWIHGTDPDAIVLVDVLRAAEAYADRYSDPAEPLVIRRARAEALLTAGLLARHLGRPANDVAGAFEHLALSLTGEDDPRLRTVRLQALYEASKTRLRLDDGRAESLQLLRRVIEEATDLPDARSLLHRSALLLLDAEEGDAAEAQSVRSLADDVLALPLTEETRRGFALHRAFLDEVLLRVPEELREAEAEARHLALINRFAAHPDDELRDGLLWALLLRYGRQGEQSSRTATALRVLGHADAAFAGDHSTVTVAARLRLAARVAEATAALGDPVRAVALSEDLARRFPGAERDPELRVPFALAELERALRLDDVGRREEARALLASMPGRFANAEGLPDASGVVAQALYWHGRQLREAGQPTESRAVIEELLERFAAADDAGQRAQAANSLFSLWQSPDVSPEEQEAARARFGVLFGQDDDPHIRGLDARRLLLQATVEAERGRKDTAVALFTSLIARHGESSEADLQDTVRLARENLGILSVPAMVQSDSASGARYRDLRARLDEADRAVKGGQVAHAEAVLRSITDDAGPRPTDQATVLLVLAALDALGGLLEDAGRWEELSLVAGRAAPPRPDLDTRAARINARAHLRLARAQAQLGDPASALNVYDALDRFAEGSHDGDIVSARETALYNRAVLLDDLGDVHGALTAYDRLLWVQHAAVPSPERRLRAVKALRNKSLLLDRLALFADSATAHRQVLDIAGAAPEPAVLQRARSSAFALATCFARLGDHRSAADTYAWIRTAHHFGFSPEELREAGGLLKLAQKAAKRQR
ncbi:tetratricopeptide repeat protein [Arthrobacter sp. RCC_34]|uniref:tetratricopeptide repeat protein n=1 Tax=Arthrobacter sp. RCC_34 TaxID=3239230 RepID=UPI0035269653